MPNNKIKKKKTKQKYIQQKEVYTYVYIKKNNKKNVTLTKL